MMKNVYSEARDTLLGQSPMTSIMTNITAQNRLKNKEQ